MSKSAGWSLRNHANKAIQIAQAGCNCFCYAATAFLVVVAVVFVDFDAHKTLNEENSANERRVRF